MDACSFELYSLLMSKDLFQNPDFLDLIDWNDITNIISSYACFNATKSYFSSTKAFLKSDEINFQLNIQDTLCSLPSALSRLTQHILKLGIDFDLVFLKDLSKGRILTLPELNSIALIFESDQIWNQYFVSSFSDSDKKLLSISPLYDKKIHHKLRSFVNEDGFINEAGFTELLQLNQEIFLIETTARKKASDLLRSSNLSYSDSGEFDIINDRYVLPVDSDRYSSQYGPIVHRSRTGMTLFVEPYELKGFSQKRSELLAKKDWIIFKKCKELSNFVAPFYEPLAHWASFLFEFDKYQTLIQWARNCNLSRPIVSTEKVIDIKGFFHPLIPDCISNDVFVDSQFNGIILSGPNTGGKTVLLKSIAITVALFRLGSWVPARSCRLFCYDKLFFFSHDLQDINQGLSSFSSEVTNYSSLINEVDNHSIVFIDEIFNSTSSEEASALAIALLEYLSKADSPHVFLSTHHHGIKTTGSTMTNFLSCHMAVSPTGDPLYKIIWGSPGSSRGVQTFTRLTLEQCWSSVISSRASELLGSNIFDYENALSDINDQKSLFEQMNQDVQNKLSKLKNDKAAFELQKETTLSILKSKQSDEFNRIVRELKSDIESFKSKNKSLKAIDDSISSKKRYFLDVVSTEKTPDNLIPLQGDITNSRVWSTSLKKFGHVLKTRDDRVFVDFNGLKSWSNKADLLLDAQKLKSPLKVSVSFEKSDRSSTQLDARGLRLEDFQKQSLDALTSLLNGDIPYLDIVHGHGEGILKKWLRTHLKNDSDFEWGPQDGNDGVTRVTVKH